MKRSYIGSPISMRKGYFVLFESELFPYIILNILEFPNNLIPHNWRDIIAYREKGIIDIQTGEGILGTEISNESLLIQKPWFYQLLDKKGVYMLKFLCGTIGQYELPFALNKDERAMIYKKEICSVDELAERLRYSSNKYEDRRIKTTENKA